MRFRGRLRCDHWTHCGSSERIDPDMTAHVKRTGNARCAEVPDFCFRVDGRNSENRRLALRSAVTPVKVAGEILDHHEVCPHGILGVISTLEFIEHRLA
jgi:hypothetical protein